MKLGDLPKLQLLLIAIVTLAYAAIFGLGWYHALTYPFSIEYEGPMIWAADKLAKAQNIYDPSRLIEAPWAVITYPPLFLCISALLFKLFGAAFWCMRLVSIVSLIVAVFFFYRILRRSECSPLIACIGPAYFIGFTPVYLWANVGRPDTLAIALGLAGLERVFAAHQNKEQEKDWRAPCVVAAVLLALGCFTKQTSLVCTVSAFLFLLWCKQAKIAALFAAVFAGLIAVLVAGAQLLSGGFLQNITFFGKAPWSEHVLLRYLHFMSDSDVLRLEIALAVLLFCIIFRKQNTTIPERIPYILFGLSLAQMLFIMGLPGSNGNHANLPLLAISWWLALKSKTLPQRIAQFVLAASLIGGPALAMYVPTLIADLPDGRSALANINLEGKLVLSEDPYLNMITRSEPAMIDCAVFTSVWMERPDKLQVISDQVVQRKYAAIIISCLDSEGKEKNFWPDSILTSIRSHYSIAGKLNGNGLCQKLWLPK